MVVLTTDFRFYLEVYSQGLSLVYLIYTCVFMDTLTHLFHSFPCKCESSFIALDNSMNGQRHKFGAENTLDNTISMNLAPLTGIITLILRIL